MIKLAVSNIAWDTKDDDKVLSYMSSKNITGLEIAPTKIIAEKPYENIEEAGLILDKMCYIYKLKIASMQSIWFGRQERMFFTEQERKILLDYTKKSILFAEKIGCKNIVFGCPKNRIINSKLDIEIAMQFFSELGDYAQAHNTVLAIEANPVIYGTNFLNTTSEVLEFVCGINNSGIRINLDLGTIICNDESLEIVQRAIPYVNHIHISEPNLKPIEKRKLHERIADILEYTHYDKFVSIEMGNTGNVGDVLSVINYTQSIFS